jgi:intracellular septation protein
MKSQKKFFLISFLPAIAYWYLEENYSLQIALLGGGLLACLEITLEKIFTKHVHSISKFNFYLIVVLGSIAFIGNKGIWFKLQPFFTGVFMGGYLLFRIFQNNSLMVETMEAMGQIVPFKDELKQIEKHMGIFLICYGIFMAYVAFELTTSQWTFFKTIGFYVISLVFFVVEFIFLRKIVNKRALL